MARILRLIQLVSRWAKTLEGDGQQAASRRAYALKHRALRSLSRRAQIAYYRAPEPDRWDEARGDFDANYYDLYSLTFREPSGTFYFHVPHHVGKRWLPRPAKLPTAGEEERDDGDFRFGRALDASEQRVWPLKWVMRELKEELSGLDNGTGAIEQDSRAPDAGAPAA